VSGGETVFEDDTGDTLGVKPLGDAVAFAAHHQAAVAAARTNNNRGTVRLLG
jgi:hypothetical protein